MKKLYFLAAIVAVALVGFARAQITTSTPAQSAQGKIKIPILTYHSVRPYYPGITNLVKEYTVPPDVFDEQLNYLKTNGFTAVTPDDVVRYFNSGTPLPPKPYMITFDDGWENQFRYAFPIVQKYNVPAVFYIYSNVINKRVFMTWDQIKGMGKMNMIIGDHTASHPQLPKVTSDASLQGEIAGSKKIIEAQIGKTIDTFAYPYGAYNAADVNDVKQAGYTSARALNECVYQSQDILFTLCGVIITGDFNRFVSIVNRQQ